MSLRQGKHLHLFLPTPHVNTLLQKLSLPSSRPISSWEPFLAPPALRSQSRLPIFQTQAPMRQPISAIRQYKDADRSQISLGGGTPTRAIKGPGVWAPEMGVISRTQSWASSDQAQGRHAAHERQSQVSSPGGLTQASHGQQYQAKARLGPNC